MKVGTDSIMLGSWLQTTDVQRILDIGTGSGLLAIMLAQKTQGTCLIDGIDIDEDAITQAKENALNCPWSQRLTFQHSSLQEYSVDTCYDLIVSNPPYFPINDRANKGLLINNRLTARQTIQLDHPTLLQAVLKYLSAQGKFCCVLPVEVTKEFTDTAESLGLYCVKELQVQSKPTADVKRLLLEFSLSDKAKICEKLSIHNNLGGYSEKYIALCKDYYLNF